MQKREASRQHLRLRGKSAIALGLMLWTSVQTLSGCAASTPPSSVECPQPAPVPESLTSSRAEEVRSLSVDAQSFLRDASEWLRSFRQTRTP